MSSKSSSKRSQAQGTRNTAALDKASNLQLEKALGEVSGASISVQSLFGQIQESLVTKHTELKAVNDAIELKRYELTELHGKDSLLLSTDDLRLEFAAEKERQDQERAELEEQRRREEEIYQYNLNTKRKLQDDEWGESVRVRERDQRIKKEEFDKTLKERHDDLMALDVEYKSAIKKAESFDDEVKKAIEREVAIVANSLKKDFSHTTQIADIQHKAAIEKLSLDNSRLSATINSNESTIASLQKQLAAAQEAQTKLASDAVNAGASQKNMADMQSLITNIGGPNGARTKA